MNSLFPAPAGRTYRNFPYFWQGISGGYTLPESRFMVGKTLQAIKTDHPAQVSILHRRYFEDLKEDLSLFFDDLQVIKFERIHLRKTLAKDEEPDHEFDVYMDIIQDWLFRLQKVYRTLYEDAGCSCPANMLCYKKKNTDDDDDDDDDDKENSSIASNTTNTTSSTD